MGKKKKDTMELRFYEVPQNEYVLALLGDSWIRDYGHGGYLHDHGGDREHGYADYLHGYAPDDARAHAPADRHPRSPLPPRGSSPSYVFL